MALRVMMVAMVAALGLELPTFGEFAAWGRSGREWVAARVADLSSLRLDADSAPAGVADHDAGVGLAANPAGSSRADLAFEAAVEAMASGFSGDLALAAPKSPRPTASGPPTPVPSVVEAEPAPLPGSRLEKISTAVRLTRQAVDAWASLIQSTTEEGGADSL